MSYAQAYTQVNVHFFVRHVIRDLRFTMKSDLFAHELIHTGQHPFICLTCNKGFIQKSILRAHELLHTGERSFICQTCNEGFHRKYLLYQHEQDCRYQAEVKHKILVEQSRCLACVCDECHQ